MIAEMIEIRKLSEVCDFQNGFAFKSNSFKQTGIPVIRISNIQDQQIDLDKIVFIDEQDYKEDLSKYKVSRGDLLIAMSGATTGKLGISQTEQEFLLNQRVGKFLPLKGLDKYYLYYFLSTKVEESLRIAAGAAQPNLSTQQIKDFEIPIPPLPEQERIVAKLDAAFAAIDAAKANVERNLHNAKELFQSKLNEVFSGEKEGWVVKSIEEVCTVVNGFAFGSNDFSIEGSVKSIKITNVGVMEFVATTDNLLPAGFDEKYKYVSVKEGDIVVALTRTIIADGLKVAIVPAEYEGALVNQRVAALLPNNNLVLSNYLYSYFSTALATDYVLEHVNTLMQPNLSIKDLRQMKLPMPDVTEQVKVVRQIDNLRSTTAQLQTNYTQKLTELETLKKSLLERAFRGEI